MLKEIYKEVNEALEEAYNKMYSSDYNSYILYIGRAEFIPELETSMFSGYVIDYQLDRYNDETREAFYLHYMNRNYTREEFHYEGDNGIDDLSIEMMIYSHMWDSTYFIKSLVRMASILSGKGYKWDVEISDYKREQFIQNNIIDPLSSTNMKISDIIRKAYKRSVRNAFAHSLYTTDSERKNISLRTRSGNEKLSFDEFQTLFLYSVILMNKMQNFLEGNHKIAVSSCGALTESFSLPNGMTVQIFSEEVGRGKKLFHELRMYRINKPEE